jgi:hypothetical protein
MQALLSSRGFDDPKFIASRPDSAPAQQLGDAFAIDRLAEVIALRVLATGGDGKFCLRVGSTPSAMQSMSRSWARRAGAGGGLAASIACRAKY